jgi:S1-C subfamily serine protease
MDEPAPSQAQDLRQRLLQIWMRRRWFVVAGLGLLFLLLILFLLSNRPSELEPLTANDVGEIVVETMGSATPPPDVSAEVYQAILPSLVVIRSEHNDEDGEESVGVGSGVIINFDGEILTAFHVVEGAASIEVQFADGTQSLAVVSTAQPENDIAVLMPETPPGVFAPAILGSLRAMRVGDHVFAVGNPLGLAGSMSAGVISGFDRSYTSVDGEHRLEGLIQFDAAVNPGNSGGPLLNRYGQVIGIVTGLVNPTEQEVFIGIGFAVPIQVAANAAGGPAQ